MSKFNYVPFNKTVTFECSLDTEHDLCRTGTVNTSTVDSFINAVLYGCCKSFIATRDETERLQYFQNFRNEIVQKINNDETFSEFKNNVISYLMECLQTIYSYVDSSEEDVYTENVEDILSIINSNLDLYKIIFTMISIDDFEKILKKTVRKWDGHTYDELNKHLISETITFVEYEEILDDIEDTRADFLKKNICFFLETLINKIKQKYKEPAVDITKLSPEIYNIVTDHFNIDVYFLDADTRLPVTLFDTINKRELNSVILLSFENEHFEVVGRLNNVNKKIQREFLPYDNIIQNMNQRTAE